MQNFLKKKDEIEKPLKSNIFPMQKTSYLNIFICAKKQSGKSFLTWNIVNYLCTKDTKI